MKREVTIWAVAVLWLAAVGCGFWLWERYDTTPGLAPMPASASVPDEQARGRWQLTLFGHPHCPCFKSSLHELAEITRAAPELSAQVVFVCPPGAGAGWERGDAWDAAARLATVEVRSDAGTEARRLGAATSGMAVLADPSGRIVFRGGLTPARGRTGVGRRAVLAWVSAGDGAPTAPVFGCPLFDSEE